MSHAQITHRRAVRRTDDYTPHTPKVNIVTEPLPLPLSPTAVLIRVHAVALNYRDANIANGGNPWPVLPHGILGNDAAGEVIATGEKVKTLAVGDRAAPITDTEQITERATKRSWLAADEDGVMADYIVYDESVLCKLPVYLDWVQASMIPCAGVTAWSALKGMRIGQTILVQGTGGVSMFALKLALAAGLRVILTSSSDAKLQAIKEKYAGSAILAVNYKNTPDMRCTRRGGVVSQVGYLGKQDPSELRELVPTLIDRRINLRGINAGSKLDMEDFCEALSASQTLLDDLIDKVFPFEQAEEAVEYVWQGKQVGKVVLRL
ncbi:Alcohol dehydrogenase GroES-like domain family protein [Aspergillus niger]|uniref:Alcohol dehydrogenase GroES-like domain family protein n=1 Tax=Aspergillus niger TaxID=5061 RepID=A0A505HRD1_ASPNG|nr:Alcohol dehydrogenase GroES-like domain family protein [Aspergillus niger]